MQANAALSTYNFTRVFSTSVFMDEIAFVVSHCIPLVGQVIPNLMFTESFLIQVPLVCVLNVPSLQLVLVLRSTSLCKDVQSVFVAT